MTATQWGVAAEAAGQTIHQAELAGDQMTARRFAGALATSVLHGPTPVDEAIAYCEGVLSRVSEDRKASAITEVALARLEAMRGNFEAALPLYQRVGAVLGAWTLPRARARWNLDRVVVGSSIVPSITARTYTADGQTFEDDTEHLIIQASPRPVPNYAKAIDGGGWYRGATVKLLGWVPLAGGRARLVFVPGTNDTAFRGHLVLVWTTGGHTYAVGFHDVLGRRKTLLLDEALAKHIRLVGAG